MKKRIAVVILNYNGVDMLRRFLPSVLEYSEDCEIVVADNASTDDSLTVMRKSFPEVRLLQLDKNYGFAEGYNRALKMVDAEYYILLNSDVEVTEHWTLPMQTYMDTHPDVAACQPKLLDFKDKSMFEYAGAAGGFLDKYGYPFCRGRIFDTVERDNGQYDNITEVFWATGAVLMIRSRDYHTVGGLDGRFFAHMEEIDLCWRLRARNRKIVCIPDSKVYHVGGATLNKSNPYKTFLNFRNNLLMLYKNLPDDELKSIMFYRCILDYIAAFKYFLSGNFAEFQAVIQARRDFYRLKDTFLPSRAECMAQTERNNIQERVPYSILWKYYCSGKRFFSDLMHS